MLDTIKKFLFSSNTGRFLLVGLVLIGIGYGARLYLVDLPAMEEKSERASGAERVDAMADALQGALADRGDELSGELPALTDWYPSTLPCGTVRTFGPTDENVWTLLGVEPETETTFQYRFEFADEEFRLIARRDTDCDGHFAVWTLTGSTDWTGLAGRKMRAQNTEE